MIKGVHTMFYSSQAEEQRAFIRDKLGFSFTDVGDGWLIFDLPEADMGVHPAAPHGSGAPGTHAISFYCDDIGRTVADLKRKGVEFTMDIEDHGFGLVTYFRMPGEVIVQLYQPRYVKQSASKPPTARAMVKKRPAARKQAATKKVKKKTAKRKGGTKR
jgi:catechol 2,3-dioxygenase-like lactoylglutathione lyase family enzyme